MHWARKAGMWGMLFMLASSSALAATTYTVTSRENDGAGSLRQAIAGATSGDTIVFNTAVMGGNSITVYSGLNVDKSLTIDGESQQVVIGAASSFILFNLIALAEGSILRNLSLVNSGQAVYISGVDNVQILNCRIGVDWSDTTRSNGWGIMVQGCTGTVIGAAGLGNVISGNSQYGVVLKIATNTVIQGNWIGMDSTGMLARPNQIGIRVLDGSTGTLVGGDRSAGQGNILSGNTPRQIEISNSNGYGGTGSASLNNRVAGNIIGLKADQSARAATNQIEGVHIENSPDNRIGINETGKGNIIAGNDYADVVIGQSARTLVQNNLIGITESGTTFFDMFGVDIDGSVGCLVGGNRADAAHERNVISGHPPMILSEAGIRVRGAASTGNTLAGNYIGLAPDGSQPRGNYQGILLEDGGGNLIGGPNNGSGSLYGNVISGNDWGVIIQHGTGNTLAGNYIGLDAAGNVAVENDYGVEMSYGTGNTIGGPPAERNVISGNAALGVTLEYGESGAYIYNNYFGTDAGGANAVSAGGTALRLLSGAHDNLIGSPSLGSGNLIVGAQTGILLDDSDTDYNCFYANTICSFANTVTGMGISLGSGANDDKAAPLIAAANTGGISGTGGNNDVIQIFKADRDENYSGGSLTLLGTATANSSGNWNFVPGGGIQPGDYVCALATDGSNNTSAFSANKLVADAPTPTPTPTSTPTATQTPVDTQTPAAIATATATPTETPALSGVDLQGKVALAYPNPGREQINFLIHLEQAAKVEIKIYNLAGERIAGLAENLSAGRGQVLSWDCRNCASGIFLAKVYVKGQERQTIKIAVAQ